MADSVHLRMAQIGIQSSANDFTSTPTPDGFIEIVGELDVSGLTQGKLEKDTLRGDNEMNPRVNGPKETRFGYQLLGRGLATQDGTTNAITDQPDLRRGLECAFGGVDGANGPGVARTVSSVAEATPTVTSNDTPSMADGSAILWSDGTDVQCREVISTATNTMTVDRGGYATGTGATIYPSLTWYVDADLHDDIHAYHRFEGEAFRRDCFAALVETCTITVPPNGGQVTFDFAWRGSDWTDVAEENPTFSAPTLGSDIIALDSPFYMGDGGGAFDDDAEWFVDELTVTITNELQPRTTPSGANGFAGFHVAKRTVTIAGSIWFGALTSDATDALLALINTSTQTLDVAFQVGRASGSAMYCRAPALDMDATIGSKNGMDVLNFTGICRRSPNHSNVPGAFRLHLF